MPTLAVNGVSLAYTDTGNPPGRLDAPVVLFGHGLLMGGWMFQAQIATLREKYRCLTLDWRGQGQSPPAPGGYDIETLTADTVAFLDALNVKSVHHVGLSMGGFVGMRLGIHHPKRLRSLTLLNTSAEPEDPATARRYRALAVAYQLLGIWPVRAQALPVLFGANFLADPRSAAVLTDWLDRIGRCQRAATRRALLGVANRSGVLAEISTIQAPTLVVAGRQDIATPPDRSKRIAAAIPDARLHLLEEAGHSSTLEQPEAVTMLIADFLATVGDDDRHSDFGSEPTPMR